MTEQMSASTPQITEDVLLARAYLSRVAEPPAVALAGLVADVGPVEAAQQVQDGRVSEAVAGETGARRVVRQAAADLDAAAAAGARLITPEHAEWPQWPFAAFSLTGQRASGGRGKPRQMAEAGASPRGRM